MHDLMGSAVEKFVFRYFPIDSSCIAGFNQPPGAKNVGYTLKNRPQTLLTGSWCQHVGVVLREIINAVVSGFKFVVDWCPY